MTKLTMKGCMVVCVALISAIWMMCGFAALSFRRFRSSFLTHRHSLTNRIRVTIVNMLHRMPMAIWASNDPMLD